MALLVLNPNNLNMELKVGALESYKPSKEIKSLVKKVSDLKTELSDKLLEITGSNDMKEINKIVSEDKEKDSKVKEYITNEYSPKLKDLLKETQEINKKICPNYTELTGKV
jgi:phage host-nuclease inhibitor protein Gam